MDPVEQIKDLAEKGTQVKLGAGVMGRTGTVICALVPVWMLAIWKMGDSVFLNISLFATALAITAVAIWWIRRLLRYAERNPGPALLEGGDSSLMNGGKRR